MTTSERIGCIVGALTIVSAFVYAGAEVGRQQERIAALTQEVSGLRTELTAVNRMLIEWTIKHSRED